MKKRRNRYLRRHARAIKQQLNYIQPQTRVGHQHATSESLIKIATLGCDEEHPTGVPIYKKKNYHDLITIIKKKIWHYFPRNPIRDVILGD